MSLERRRRRRKIGATQAGAVWGLGMGWASGYCEVSTHIYPRVASWPVLRAGASFLFFFLRFFLIPSIDLSFFCFIYLFIFKHDNFLSFMIVLGKLRTFKIVEGFFEFVTFS